MTNVQSTEGSAHLAGFQTVLARALCKRISCRLSRYAWVGYIDDFVIGGRLLVAGCACSEAGRPVWPARGT